MISALIAVAAIFCFLVLVELITRHNTLRDETSRKLVHITVGGFIAFWPFFMTFRMVQLLSVALLLVVLMSKFFNIFKSIHTIPRFSLGELCLPIGIGLCALLTDSKWIFAAAILHMSLADGLAAVIGLPYIKKPGHYRIFGQIKTFAGSLTFFVVSVVITGWIVLYSGAGFDQSVWPVIIWLPIFATMLENFSPYGTDNLFVPLLVLGVLSSL